jgi:hypothetical protein
LDAHDNVVERLQQTAQFIDAVPQGTVLQQGQHLLVLDDAGVSDRTQSRCSKRVNAGAFIRRESRHKSQGEKGFMARGPAIMFNYTPYLIIVFIHLNIMSQIEHTVEKIR